METTRDKILKALRQQPNVNPTEIDALIYAKHDKGVGLVKAVIKRGLITEQDMLVLLVKELQIPSIDLTKYRLDDKLKSVITEKIARQYNVVPISSFSNTITVAVSDPLNVFAIDDLRNITSKEIDMVICTETQIVRAIDQFYIALGGDMSQVTKAAQAADFEILDEEQGPGAEDVRDGEQAPVIRMVNLVIKEALRQRASDIHMEPFEEGMRVRYRIDGVLQDSMMIPQDSQNAVIVRIKIMSRLDITTYQTPQDGRFKMRFGTNEIDFRVSMLPTTFGQKIVMRVLDKGNLSVGLNKLGFSPYSMKVLEEMMYKPFGMILVTGPTGSGKSTTLYSIINKLNTPERNIITIEDPVEYLVEGLTQIEVKHDIGLDFKVGLKAVLRQSPDVVMVGEIRDGETADIAIKASLTGQLVLSTLHTNDAAGSITRLVDMGLEPFLVSSSLLAICSQRLCRRICQHCKHPVQLTPEAFKKIEGKVKPGTVFYEGKGCDRCRHTGYLGRLGVTEILAIDDQIREMIIKGESSAAIGAYACEKQGMKLLFDDVVDKMCAGETTLAEVYRIASEDE